MTELTINGTPIAELSLDQLGAMLRLVAEDLMVRYANAGVGAYYPSLATAIDMSYTAGVLLEDMK